MRVKLALFLGMLSGDGCLTIRRKKAGYKCYATEFFNSNLDLISLYRGLLFDLFGVEVRPSSRLREGRTKVTYECRTYSKYVFSKCVDMGFPIGKKRDKLRVVEFIMDGRREDQIAFLKGLTITDGSIKKSGTVVFHMGSKKFLEDVSELIFQLFGIRKPIKEYIQKEKFYSYQALLNKS